MNVDRGENKTGEMITLSYESVSYQLHVKYDSIPIPYSSSKCFKGGLGDFYNYSNQHSFFPSSA